MDSGLSLLMGKINEELAKSEGLYAKLDADIAARKNAKPIVDEDQVKTKSNAGKNAIDSDGGKNTTYVGNKVKIQVEQKTESDDAEKTDLGDDKNGTYVDCGNKVQALIKPKDVAETTDVGNKVSKQVVDDSQKKVKSYAAGKNTKNADDTKKNLEVRSNLSQKAREKAARKARQDTAEEEDAKNKAAVRAQHTTSRKMALAVKQKIEEEKEEAESDGGNATEDLKIKHENLLDPPPLTPLRDLVFEPIPTNLSDFSDEEKMKFAEKINKENQKMRLLLDAHKEVLKRKENMLDCWFESVEQVMPCLRKLVATSNEMGSKMKMEEDAIASKLSDDISKLLL